MHSIRIIPRLDIKGPNLVKGIHLEGLRVLGKPEAFARHYYQHGADELFFQDTVASLYGRNSLHEIISRTATENFIPLTVGGGIRTLEDIRQVLRAGADKVAINTAAVKSPEFIEEAAHRFGSSTILIAIEAIKQPDGRYLVYTDNGREHTGIEVTEWAMRAEQLGAGELIITSVDREGTGQGFDLKLTKVITSSVKIPVIAHGGAGSVEDIYEVVKEGKADAVAIASILHYETIKTIPNIGAHEGEGNTSFLSSGRDFQKVIPTPISEIKKHLRSHHLSIR